MTEPAPETLHASCVAIGEEAVLLVGRSGAGKSDLALRLIDRGACLVSDDYTILTRTGDELRASAPGNIAGKMEVRGIGIVDMHPAADIPVRLMVDLDRPPERLPAEGATVTVAGVAVAVLALDAHAVSAPIKVELALRQPR